MPRASIVIRTFNEQKQLGNLFNALDQQTFRDFETIVVDSGSTDATLTIARQRSDKLVEIASHDFTFGYSLNIGCRNSRGDILVNVSAHAIPVDNHWLEALVSSFEDDQVAIVYGRHLGASDTKFSERRDFEKIFGNDAIVQTQGPYYANNGNSAIRKSLWEEEPWGEHLTGLEDIAWAGFFGAKGYSVVYEPKAAVYHIHEESWYQVYNRYRREALAARHIGLAAPPHGSQKLWHFAANLVSDILAALKKKDYRLGEICRFRYYHWRGALHGWLSGAIIVRRSSRS